MQTITRRTALKRFFSLLLSVVFYSKSFAKFLNNEKFRKPVYDADANYIIDLHCHPNMKHYLFNDHMYRCHLSFAGENKIVMQVDANHLRKGKVKGFFAAHHIPERGMTEQALGLRKIARLAKFIAPEFASKVEHGDPSNYRQLTSMMDEFEYHIKKTDEKEGNNFIRIAKSVKEFKSIIAQGQIAVAQSIEGGHCLGRGCTTEDYLRRLQFLRERGICSITLSHFFENDFSFPVEGIPPHEKEQNKLRWRYDPSYDDRGMTETGKAVVNYMLEAGILIDLTHMTPAGRKEVFDANDAYAKKNNVAKRPIIFTHTGVRSAYIYSRALDSYKYIAASEPELRRIKDCNGVIGIVFMNFWLKGMDTHAHPDHDRDAFKNGIEYVLETIDRIHDYTGVNNEFPKSYDHISIGSDFDGFADAPHDLKNPKYFPKLVAAMSAHGISDPDIQKITHGNAMRVLENGWGN